MERLLAFSRRIETAYLSALRIVVLVVATLFVVGAAIFLVDALRRMTTGTRVVEPPVKVAPNEAVAGVAIKKDIDSATSKSDDAQLSEVRKKLNAFKGGIFGQYYTIYSNVARRYNKPEDKIISRDEMAELLGYTVEAYQKGEDRTVRLFVDDPAYGSQALDAAKALTTDQRVAGQLQQYRSAQKTAQACSTQHVTRRVWDSYSTSCANWYESPIGCPVLRQVPVQRCVPAYPEGITSPVQAFAQLDNGFRLIWRARQEQNAVEAQAKRERLQATKASGLPTLLQALQMFGAFLVVMFVFLVIAIERHLRRLSQTVSAERTTTETPDGSREALADAGA